MGAGSAGERFVALTFYSRASRKRSQRGGAGRVLARRGTRHLAGHAREGQLRARARRVKQLLRGHGRRAAAVGQKHIAAIAVEEATRLAVEDAFDDQIAVDDEGEWIDVRLTD